MALISCPECKRQISDRAAACPHCGYPSPAKGTSDGGGSIKALLARYEAWQAQAERYRDEVDAHIRTHMGAHHSRPWETRYEYRELRSFVRACHTCAGSIAERVASIRAFLASGATPQPKQFDYYTTLFQNNLHALQIEYNALKAKGFAPEIILSDPTQRPW